MVFFLSPDRLKQDLASDNIADEYIRTANITSHNRLRELIGDHLYETMEARVDANTVQGNYETFMEDYVIPYLEYTVMGEMCVLTSLKQRNIGIVTNYDQSANSNDLATIKYVEKYWKERSEYYSVRMLKWLKKGYLPEWGEESDEITKPANSKPSFIGGVYLGSGKGCAKPVSSSTPSPSPVPTANAVLYTEQALTDSQKAQARTNIGAGVSNFSGDYNDLANKPTDPTGEYQANWNEADPDSPSYIQNKPTIPAEQINSDWEATVGKAVILNKPQLFSGSYNDLTDKPVIPDAQVQANWNEADPTSKAFIQNKPDLSSSLKKEIVVSLPVSDIDLNTIYMVLKQTPGTNDIYDEYMYINSAWEHIGDTSTTFTQVQSNWSENDQASPSYIQNKPSIPANIVTGVSQAYSIWTGTQAQYDELDSYSNSVIYLIF